MQRRSRPIWITDPVDARNLLSLAGVLLVLGGTGYYWGLGRSPAPVVSREGLRQPVFEIDGIRSRETGDDGRVRRELVAPQLVQYSGPDEALLESPQLRLYENGELAWDLRAGRGRRLDQQREIRLEGGVTAERRSPAAQPLRFTTPRLTAWPAEERLLADQGVQLSGPQGELSSQRLEARLAVGTLLLDQNVSGHYAPAPR